MSYTVTMIEIAPLTEQLRQINHKFKFSQILSSSRSDTTFLFKGTIHPSDTQQEKQKWEKRLQRHSFLTSEQD